jgi:ribonuclease HI
MQVSSISTNQSITVFTDGSCHAQLKKGGWASILFIGDEKIILEGNLSGTTHHRMELTAVLQSLEYLQSRGLIENQIVIHSDSQYVVDLQKRKERLVISGYQTKKSKPVRNSDLVQSLIIYMDYDNIKFIKIKSHQKHSDLKTLLNREVDILSRKNMRQS